METPSNESQHTVREQDPLMSEKEKDQDHAPIGLCTGLIGGYVAGGALMIACPWLLIAEPVAAWIMGASMLTGAKLGFDYDEKKNK